MKHLLITLLLAVLFSNCLNPLDYGETVTVKVSSADYNFDFDCNIDKAQECFGWYENSWYYYGTLLDFGEVGIKLLPKKDILTVRITHYQEDGKPYLPVTVDFQAKDKVYDKLIEEFGTDTAHTTGLKISYE